MKFNLQQAVKAQMVGTSTLSLTSALYRDKWSPLRSSRFIPGKQTRCQFTEAGLGPEPVWTGAENIASSGIRSPDLPARSQPLYRLRYLGRHSDCSDGHWPFPYLSLCSPNGFPSPNNLMFNTLLVSPIRAIPPATPSR
jgi:hypothetical protein